MQIRLDQGEICTALENDLRSQGVSLKGKKIHVEIETEGGRTTPRTYVAIIEIKNADTLPEPHEPAITTPILDGV